MAKGQSPIDAMVGEQPEDLVKRLNPSAGKADASTESVDEGGGTSKLPDPPTPFTLKK